MHEIKFCQTEKCKGKQSPPATVAEKREGGRGMIQSGET